MSGKRFYIFLILLFVTAIVISVFLFKERKDSSSVIKNIDLTTSEKEYLADHKNSITYINDSYFPPISFVDNTGSYTGINEDYLRLLESRLNIKFKRVYAQTWKEALELIKNGKIDIIGGIAVTPERLKFLIFTPGFTDAPSVFITRKNYKNINNRSDLRYKKVAATESFAVIEYLKSAEPSIIIVPVSNDLEGLKKVSSGELDAVASDYATASYFIEKLGFTNLRIAAETGMDYNLHFGINNKNTILASIMIKGVASFTDEERRAIKKRWIHLEFDPFVLGRNLWMAIAGLLFLIVAGSGIFLIWNRVLSIKVRQRTSELNEYKDKLELLVEERTKKLQDTVEELNASLENVKTLSGLIPICARCKNIRDDEGYWLQTEEYIRTHTEAEFSHSLCPSCAAELYGKEKWFKKE